MKREPEDVRIRREELEQRLASLTERLLTAISNKKWAEAQKQLELIFEVDLDLELIKPRPFDG